MTRVLRLLVALGIFAITVPAGAAESFTARVVGVTDGDTIKVLRTKNLLRIRLYGIDAPEKRQPFGTRAKQFLSSLVFGRDVQVTPTGHSYNRIVARVAVDGADVSASCARAGMAWWYRRYAPRDALLEQAEAEARKAHRGLWGDANAVAPWEWRKRR